MPDNVDLQVVAKTLTAATITAVISQNPSRKYLLLQNTGTGSVTFYTKATGFGAGTGFVTLDPATGAGGQGGSIEFTEAIPNNPIWAYSTAGTTICVSEG